MWSEGGVSPPSTAMKSGEGDCVIKDEMYARFGLIDALMNGCRLRVPVAMNCCTAVLTFQGTVKFVGGSWRQ